MTRLKLSTLDTGYCDNAELTASALVNNGTIEVKIHELSIGPSDCQLHNIQPSRNLNIDILANGSYPVSLQMGTNLFYEGFLNINDRYYELSIPGAESITINPAITYKIPEGAVWYRVYYKAGQKELAENCVNAIDRICTEAPLSEGYYSKFALKSGAETLLIEDQYPHLFHTDQVVVLNPNQIGFESLLEIFRTYQDSAGHQFFVTAESWQAEVVELK